MSCNLYFCVSGKLAVSCRPDWAPRNRVGYFPPRFVGVHGVLLEHRLRIVSGASPATRTELGSWDRDCGPLKTSSISHLVLCRKRLPAPRLEAWSFSGLMFLFEVYVLPSGDTFCWFSLFLCSLEAGMNMPGPLIHSSCHSVDTLTPSFPLGINWNIPTKKKLP